MKKYSHIYVILLTLGCGYFSTHALAQNGVEVQPNTTEPTFGRLFYTHHQRLQLDASRSTQSPQRGSQPFAPAQKINLPARVEPVTLNGYVKRSDGKSTVWVNQQPIQENAVLDDMQIGKLNHQPEIQQGRKITTPSEKLNIRIPANGQRIQLKAGQQFDPQNNQVKEITTVAKEKQLQLSASPNEMTEIE